MALIATFAHDAALSNELDLKWVSWRQTAVWKPFGLRSEGPQNPDGKQSKIEFCN